MAVADENGRRETADGLYSVDPGRTVPGTADENGRLGRPGKAEFSVVPAVFCSKLLADDDS